MRNTVIIAVLAAAILAPVSVLAGSWDSWHKDIEAGRKAAKASGKPLLVITTWKDGV